MEKKVFLDTIVLIEYLAACRDYLAASIIITLSNEGHFILLVSSLSFAMASCIMNANYKKTNAEIVELYFCDYKGYYLPEK